MFHCYQPHRFTLNQDDGSYTLSIETECPLDTVVLQCDVPVDLQEVDKSMAAVSYTPDPEVRSLNNLLCALSFLFRITVFFWLHFDARAILD